jgi:phosphoribosyl-ATP pyrophosphohydrolase
LLLNNLEKIIQDRKKNPVEGSYTNSLQSAGLEHIAQKVGEEAVELVIAAISQSRERIVEETADLLYHLLVFLNAKGISLAEIEDELENRHTDSSK